MKTISDFPIGSVVRFGRSGLSAERTLGTVIGHGRTKIKVRQDEARGQNRAYPVGTIWTVPPGLVEIVHGTAPKAASKAKSSGRSEEAILKDAQQIRYNLEPENLSMDGERSYAEQRHAAASLHARWKQLEAELGRPITEFGTVFVTASRANGHSFRPGQKVAFEDGKGNTIMGFVKRVNQKTISVQPLGGCIRYWRVSPSFLRVV